MGNAVVLDDTWRRAEVRPGVRYVEDQVSGMYRPRCQVCTGPGVRYLQVQVSGMYRTRCQVCAVRDVSYVQV